MTQTVPLQKSDIGKYDIVADGKLTRKEMNEEQWGEFVERLSVTSAAVIESDLMPAMDAGLPYLVRKRLLDILNGSPDGELTGKVKILVKDVFDVKQLCESDISRFDITADGKLTRKELTDEDFEELVGKLLITDSEDVKTKFRSMMDYGLFYAVHNRLKELSVNEGLEPAVLSKVLDLLKHEFSDDLIYLHGRLFNNFGYSSFEQEYFNGVPSLSDAGSYFLFESFAAGLEFRPKISDQWRLSVAAMALPGYLITGTNSRQVSGSSPEVKSDEKRKNLNILGTTSFELFKTNGVFKTGGNFSFEKLSDVPPDMFSKSISCGGVVELMNPLDSPWSISANAQIQNVDFAPPELKEFKQKSSRSRMITGEGTYKIDDDTGLSAKYIHSFSNNVLSTLSALSSSHDASAVAKWKVTDADNAKHILVASAGYVGAMANQKFTSPARSFGVSENSFYGSLGWTMWPVQDLLSTSLFFKSTANHSEGTLTGWYPSFDVSANLELTPGPFNILMGAVCSLEPASLYYDAATGPVADAQSGMIKKHLSKYELSTALRYSPSVRLEFEFDGKLAYTHQSGLLRLNLVTLAAALKAKWRILRDPFTLWWKTEVTASTGEENRSYSPQNILQNDSVTGTTYLEGTW